MRVIFSGIIVTQVVEPKVTAVGDHFFGVPGVADAACVVDSGRGVEQSTGQGSR